MFFTPGSKARSTSYYNYLDLRVAARCHAQHGDDYAFERVCGELRKEMGQKAEAYVREMHPEISGWAEAHQQQKAKANQLIGSSDSGKSGKATITPRPKVLLQSVVAERHQEGQDWVDVMHNTGKEGDRELRAESMEEGWIDVVDGEDWTLLRAHRRLCRLVVTNGRSLLESTWDHTTK